jgi:hypothetical protein
MFCSMLLLLKKEMADLSQEDPIWVNAAGIRLGHHECILHKGCGCCCHGASIWTLFGVMSQGLTGVTSDAVNATDRDFLCKVYGTGFRAFSSFEKCETATNF